MSRGVGGGRQRQRGPRRQRRQQRHGQPQRALSPNARRFIAALGVLGGVLVFLFGLGLIIVFIIPVLILAWDAADVVFFVGAAIIVGVAVVSVSVAGPSFFRGLPFHLAGVLAPFALGSYLSSFERLTAAGGLIYLASWCWVFLGDTVVRLIQARRSSSPPVIT